MVKTRKDFGTDTEAYMAYLEDLARRVEEGAKKICPEPQPEADPVDVLNRKHAVVTTGGKTVVVCWEPWELDSSYVKPEFMKFGDFKNQYSNRRIQVSEQRQQALGEFWLASPRRKQFSGIGFEPGLGEPVECLPGNRLNLWRGLAVKAAPGSWRLLRRHIYLVLGGGDFAAGRYIVRWIAWMLRNMGKPPETALVFKGEEGCGKGTLGRALARLFGPYAMQISNADSVSGAFSGHLHHCVFLFADEAFWAGNVKAEGRLKSLITEPMIDIRPMYLPPFQARNCLHLMMASNNDWVVPAAHDARRYAVFEVSSARVGDQAYFDALNAEISSGGLEAMVWDLKNLDLGEWHPRELVMTEALADQKAQSLRGLEAWVESILQAGQLPAPLSAKYPNRCLTKDLLASAKAFDRYTNDTVMASTLKRLVGVTPFNVQTARGWQWPPLAECRAAFERRCRGWRWHHDVREWTCPEPILDRVVTAFPRRA